MNKYYFTFGIHHIYANQVQVIVAPDKETAMTKMFKLFGNNWAIDYTEEQWIESQELSSRKYIERDYIYCGNPGMIFGEMRSWTERLNQILGASQVNKARRLKQFKQDIVDAYPKEKWVSGLADRFVVELYAAADMYL